MSQAQSENVHVFCVADTEKFKNLDKATQDKWLKRYPEEFCVRRPTIGDKQAIAMVEASNMSRFGVTSPESLDTATRNINYIFAYFAVVGEKVPDWFDQGKLYERDEDVIFAVFMEVSRWLDTFLDD